jgi:hypothetical protein
MGDIAIEERLAETLTWASLGLGVGLVGAPGGSVGSLASRTVRPAGGGCGLSACAS